MVVWARAEQALLHTLAFILDTDINLLQPAYYRIPTYESRTKFILGLLTEWDNSSAEKIAHICVKLSKLATVRNGWVHGDWAVSTTEQETVIFDFRAASGSKNRRRPVKAADVSNHVTAVYQRAMELEDMIGVWKNKRYPPSTLSERLERFRSRSPKEP